MSQKHIFAISLVLVSVGIAGSVGIYTYRHTIDRSLERATLPAALPYAGGELNSQPRLDEAAEPVSALDPTSQPREVNLAIPFTPQAPHANWELPYKEFCEEASVLMVMRYIASQDITSAEDAAQAMLAIQDFEEEAFGHYKDTNADETAAIISDFYDYSSVELLPNPTAQDIRAALAAGKPVIMPAAGRLLGNPHFQSPGPLYHMLVLKGYTKNGDFITNDPGTRHGADYIYSESTIMNAIHDWRTDEKILQGDKVVIIVG